MVWCSWTVEYINYEMKSLQDYLAFSGIWIFVSWFLF